MARQSAFSRQVESDSARWDAARADLGHLCAVHAVTPEAMKIALERHDIRDIDTVLRMAERTPHDPFAGLA